MEITLREGLSKYIHLNPKESRGSNFPFPWASNSGDDHKCIILQIGNNRIALWDDKESKAFCNPNGEHWRPNGDLIKGSNGHGDYELVFNSDSSFELRKRS